MARRDPQTTSAHRDTKPNHSQPRATTTPTSLRFPAALCSGLPSRSEIDTLLQRLAGPVTLGPSADTSKDGMSGSTEQPYSASFSPGAPVTYNDSLHQEFLRDFKHDVAEIELRLQRLKLITVRHLMRGTLLDDADFLTRYRLDHAPLAQACDQIARAFREKQHPTIADREALFQSYNLMVPREYHLFHHELLAAHDATLIHNLIFAASMRPETISPSEERQWTGVLDRIGEYAHKLQEFRDTPLLFDAQSHEETLSTIRDGYRELVKIVATNLELGSYFAPSYGASLRSQKGAEQQSTPFKTDYQRFQMPEEAELEQRLARDFYTRHPQSERTFHCALFPSGLAAFHAVLELLKVEQARLRNGRAGYQEAKILKTRDIYYEVDGLLGKFALNTDTTVTTYAPTDIERLCKDIRTELPIAVFLNPMSNMYDMEVSHVVKVLESLTQTPGALAAERYLRSASQLYIIIDNSTLGALARWKEFDISRLPNYVRLVAIESMVKFGQDGLDVAPAGLLAISGQYVESDLRQIKARTGLVIPENTVRKLSLVSDAAALERKMQRHSRNTEYLSDFMHRLAQKEGPINEVVHPFLPTHPQHDLARRELGGAGGLFHLGIRDDLFPPPSRGEMTTPPHAAEVAEGFTKLVVLLARCMNVEIRLGTSYGFSVTRMAVYQRNLTESAAAQDGYWNVPYIRVAPGTETMKDTHLLAAVMQRAYEIFGEAHKNGTLLSLLESLNDRSLQVELQT